MIERQSKHNHQCEQWAFPFLVAPLLSIWHLCPINMNTTHRQLGFRLIIGEAKNEKRGRECF